LTGLFQFDHTRRSGSQAAVLRTMFKIVPDRRRAAREHQDRGTAGDRDGERLEETPADVPTSRPGIVIAHRHSTCSIVAD
jgi:hypothetical protein